MEHRYLPGKWPEGSNGLGKVPDGTHLTLPFEFDESTCLPVNSRPYCSVSIGSNWPNTISVQSYLSANSLPECPALVCIKHVKPTFRALFVIDARIRRLIRSALDEVQPYCWPVHDGVCTVSERAVLFGLQFWKLGKGEEYLDDEQLRLTFLDHIDKERMKFERLKNKFRGVAGSAVKPKRETISEAVRMFVWRRDGGRCVLCGCQERLEYDHIIPVSLGGSSTERNIQLLCERCNRQKSNSI